jgi:purine-cytosine permease-like protein
MNGALMSINSAPKITEIEKYGVDIIPARDRTSRPFDLFRITFGGANSFATVLLGAFPIFFGLSLVQGLLATLLGVIVGALILAPMAVFGPLNGTNNAVSSGAHFGVVGRILGSFLSLLTAIAFYSIAVWTAGDALIGGAVQLFGLTDSQTFRGIAYGIMALLVLIICIYGYHFMLWVNKIVVAGASFVFILGFIAFSGDINFSYAGAFPDSSAAGFWPAFLGSAFIVLSNPISFGAFLGDWSRYIPKDAGGAKVMRAAFLAQIASLLPFIFGLVTTAIVAEKAPESFKNLDYVGGLLASTPGWFLWPLLFLAILGGFSTGTTALYGTGLDFSSVFPKLSRVQATLLIGSFTIGLIFIGRFAFNIVTSVTTFVTLIIVCTTPWMVMMMVGYLHRRGHYLSEDLQVFNRGQKGGAYWFRNGVNVEALAIWILSAVLSISFVNLPGQFVGPLGNLFNGLDISLLVAVVVPAVLYTLNLMLVPEASAIHGEKGARFRAAVNKPIAPIEKK